MKLFLKNFAAALILSAYTMVHATDFSYSSISASFSMFSEDVPGVTEDMEGDGINISFSLEVTDNIAFLAGLGTGSADVSSGGMTVESDIDSTTFGLMYHAPASTSTDFYVGFAIIDGTVDLTVNGTPQPSDDAKGNVIALGIRSMISDILEVEAFIDRSDVEDNTSSEVGAEAKYYLNTYFSVNAGYSFNSDGNSLSFGATKYF